MQTELNMTDNRKLDLLFELLEKAENLAKQYTGGYSSHFQSAEEFHAALTESISKLKAGDMRQIESLWLWFLPSYDWDDFIRDDREQLANPISEILSELKQ